jgi:rhodanese-related sulfurtransferase
MNKSIFLALILVAVSLVIAALLFVRFNPAELHVSETDISMLAQQIIRGEDHVTVEELSDRIIKARNDYLLIDLRPAAQYAKRHIDTAVHMPLSELVKPDVLDGLPEDRVVIVYSNSTTNAAQAATILRMSGIPAYSLIGGYNHWSAYMTDPVAAGIAEHDARQQAKYDAVRCYLEGEYVAEAGLVVKQPEGAGFTPPLIPVEEDQGVEDPLGLGLGLGVDTETESQDPLGLGLGLGLDTGPGVGGARKGLRIGKGC